VPDITQPTIEIVSADGPLLQVWPDGRIAWSDDTIGGGPTMRTSAISPAAVTSAIEAIRNSPLLGGQWINEVRTGPGSSMTRVRVRDGSGLIVDAGSWHPRFEADPRLVVTAAGVEPLNSRSREEVLLQQPADYRLFRQRWEEVLGRLRGLIPAK